MIWSWLLAAVGVFGLWLAGRRNVYGWAVGFGAQALWIAYATATRQWGFYASAAAYGWVYGKNFLAWRREASAPVLVRSPPRRTPDGNCGAIWKNSSGSWECAMPAGHKTSCLPREDYERRLT